MATSNPKQEPTLFELTPHRREYNPEMIRLARESRSITQTELCQLMGIRQGTISKLENGLQSCGIEVIELAAKALNYPTRFFQRNSNAFAIGEAYFRRYMSVSSKTLGRVEARINIMRMVVEDLLKSVDGPDDNLIQWDVERDGDPQAAARTLRERWRVPKGPIRKIIELLEDNGVIVIPFDFGDDDVDGLSVRTVNNVPIIFFNKNLKGDRQRLTIAHEAGHLVMHIRQTVGEHRNVEKEAFRFASEFVVPAAEFARTFTKLNLQTLANLKRYWQVSMSSLIYKAAELELITANQSRYLYNQMAKQGYMKSEPATLDVPKEQPTLIREIIDLYINEMAYTTAELAETVCLSEADFVECFLLRENKRGPFTILRNNAA